MKYIICLKLIFFLLIISLSSCKENNHDIKLKETEEHTEENPNENLEQLDQRQAEYSIESFQGIWKSYSLYLEHELQFKDYNVNEYYKIIYGKNTLDITIVDSEENTVNIDQGYLGFMDNNDFVSSTDEKNLLKQLKESGKKLTRFKKGLKSYKPEDIESNTSFSRYSEVGELFHDEFKYNDEKEKINFRLIESLPKKVFEILKARSEEQGINYIKNYNIKEYSKKVKVTSEKTFFHTQKTSEPKRKAFLLKGDIAYIEYSNDIWGFDQDWVNVYYDGKVVSGGYLKRDDVEDIDSLQEN